MRRCPGVQPWRNPAPARPPAQPPPWIPAPAPPTAMPGRTAAAKVLLDQANYLARADPTRRNERSRPAAAIEARQRRCAGPDGSIPGGAGRSQRGAGDAGATARDPPRRPAYCRGRAGDAGGKHRSGRTCRGPQAGAAGPQCCGAGALPAAVPRQRAAGRAGGGILHP